MTVRNEPWITGSIATAAGRLPVVSTELKREDIWGHVKCRTTSYRNDYTVLPGLYAAGTPDVNSDVVVTANYKYSFDIVRSELSGVNVWVLVLDTKGINVWCAAGKGTFGTDELVRRIKVTCLSKFVKHRRLILPQLGAVGVSGYKVTRATGFKIIFGPVHAKDIRDFIAVGYKATPEMRDMEFTFRDRLVLTPMEITPAMKKFPLFAFIILFIFGLRPEGIFFADALSGGLPFLALGLISVFAGSFFTPVLLPYIPFRSFAVKGWIAGMIAVLPAMSADILESPDYLLSAIAYIFFPMLSSYWALQFTGSTTFTSMSGVRKEMKIAIPVYIGSLVITGILVIAFKISQWSFI